MSGQKNHKANNRELFSIALTVIMTAVLLAVTLQSLIRIIDHTLAYLLLLSLPVLIIWARKPLLYIIGKPQFAISIVLIIALATAFGTLIPQMMSPSEYAHRYGRVAYTIINLFGLYDLFHSWWYVSLYLLLIASLLDVSLKKNLSRRHIGFHLTHLGVVLIIIFVWVDFFFGFQGIIPLRVGESASQLTRYYRNTGIETGTETLDIQLRLDGFSSSLYDPDYRIQLWENTDSDDNVPVASFPILEGREIPVFATGTSVVIVQYYPNHYWRYEPEIPVEEMTPRDPVAIVRLTRPDRESRISLRANDSLHARSVIDGHHKLTIEFAWSETFSPENTESAILLDGSETAFYSDSFSQELNCSKQDVNMWYTTALNSWWSSCIRMPAKYAWFLKV